MVSREDFAVLSCSHRSNLSGPLSHFSVFGERTTRALQLLCLCTWKLCLFSSPLNAQTCFDFFPFFYVLEPRATSWGSFPSFLSEKSEVICKLCPFQPTQVHAAVSSEGYAVLGRVHWCTCLGKREKKASWRSFISVTFPFGFMTCDLYNVKSQLDMWDFWLYCILKFKLRQL